MYAAVVRAFDQPPRYETFDLPGPTSNEQTTVRVLAAGLHPRVRSGASGAHYSSDAVLPLIPGIDGVGETPDGELVYFVLLDATLGSMAERAVVERRRTVPLPADADAVRVAAAMNPAMSSWLALRLRARLQPGRSVLVLGATGNAGRLAVQIAKRLGAGRVVAAGRDAERLAGLPALGADELVSLGGESEAVGRALAAAAADVDVVVDYLWGAQTENAIPALLAARSDRARALTWVHVGAVAGRTLALDATWLRAADLRLLGSGQGSISIPDIAAQLPALAAEIVAGGLAVEAVERPLRDVEAVWSEAVGAGRRVVLVP